MNTRFKNLQPKENMFKRKSNLNTNQKVNNRWKDLKYNDSNNDVKKNSFKKKFELKQNNRWNTLSTDESKKNHFKHKNHRVERNHRFKGRKESKKSTGLFSKAAFVDGVPQIKGSTQKSFNIMDSIKIKPSKQKKQKKEKNKSPKNVVKVEEPKIETEEEKKQNELWKKQLLQQYAYESFSEEEDEIDE